MRSFIHHPLKKPPPPRNLSLPPPISPMHPPSPRSLLPRAPRQGPLKLQQRAADLIANGSMSLLRVMVMVCRDHGGMSVCGARRGTTAREEASAAARGGGGRDGGTTTAGGEKRHIVWFEVLGLSLSCVWVGSCKVAV